jgi:EAL domain-containing protein (putative c-di-GMP-specific phosphodiesterase class I)
MLEAAREVRRWNDALAPERRLYVSVNLSAHDMRLADMGDYVAGVLAEAGIAPQMLRLEVTESSMIDNLRAAIDLIARFRAMGVKVLLDDFGTGYSSLSYLSKFEIDFLKIDQSFVRQMTPDPRSYGIVRAILSMCEGMNIRTVAEGIENAEAMQLLLGLGCDYGQGYHFSRPVEAGAAAKLIAQANAAPPAATPRMMAAD